MPQYMGHTHNTATMTRGDTITVHHVQRVVYVVARTHARTHTHPHTLLQQGDEGHSIHNNLP